MNRILSEETIVTVETLQELEGLGFLDKSKQIMIPTLSELTQTQREIEIETQRTQSQSQSQRDQINDQNEHENDIENEFDEPQTYQSLNRLNQSNDYSQSSQSYQSSQMSQSQSLKLRKGGKLQLPLWLAKTLQDQGYVKIVVNTKMNKEYNREFLEKMKMGLIENNELVSMKTHPHYFEVGSQLAERTSDATLAESIRKLVLLRYRLIYDLATNSINTINAKVDSLTTSEKELYHSLYDTNAAATKVRTMENENMGESIYHDHYYKK